MLFNSDQNKSMLLSTERAKLLSTGHSSSREATSQSRKKHSLFDFCAAKPEQKRKCRKLICYCLLSSGLQIASALRHEKAHQKNESFHFDHHQRRTVTRTNLADTNDGHQNQRED
ncbi:hypothetical protein ABZP36_011136 [Zizania latifolia]